MRAATSAAIRSSFLRSGRAARTSKIPQKCSISVYSGHTDVKEHCIKDCVLIDPACGSGNFLTETYLCLRKLEDKVLDELQFGQLQWSGTEEEEAGERISLGQFHGIEINDFAVSVAETALYISRLKANNDTMMLLDLDSGDLPLKESAHIVHGNALRLDWNSVMPASRCGYIMGNPPFVGSSLRTSVQTEDMGAIAFAGMKTWGKVDYCGAWYYMAAKYITDNPVRAAFVSTNSLTQGEQVKPMWEAFFKMGFTIDFAYWSSII